MRALNGLTKAGLVKMDDSMALTSNEAGRYSGDLKTSCLQMVAPNQDQNELISHRSDYNVKRAGPTYFLVQFRELVLSSIASGKHYWQI